MIAERMALALTIALLVASNAATLVSDSVHPIALGALTTFGAVLGADVVPRILEHSPTVVALAESGPNPSQPRGMAAACITGVKFREILDAAHPSSTPSAVKP